MIKKLILFALKKISKKTNNKIDDHVINFIDCLLNNKSVDTTSFNQIKRLIVKSKGD